MALDRPKPPNRLPLWLKVAYTAFVAVVVPVYWYSYGPTNFLYFCDVALLMTVPAVWLECSLLVSSALVGIFLVQMVWVADFLSRVIGFPVTGDTGMTWYMFNPENLLFTRFLSFFHFWLPFFLLGLTIRLGYDRRAIWVWTVLAWVLLSVGYFVLPAPPAPRDNPNLPVNVNYVWGFNDEKPENPFGLDPNLYFALVMLGLPLGILLPSHLVFMAVLPRAASSDPKAACAAPGPPA